MKEFSVPSPQEARLETSVEMGPLCAFYGGLLTDKQLQAMQLHFAEDLSLGEIARQMNVSRQNVHDLIARSSEKLRACEAALGAAGRMERMLERLGRVQELLEALDRQAWSPDARALTAEAARQIQLIQQEEEDAHGL